ncbi:MAG: MarR family winged helix-turn-helix transcriptional regulator [Candidatus Hermodarchaeota archaeon]
MSDSSNTNLTRSDSLSSLSTTFDLIFRINKKFRGFQRKIFTKYNVTVPQYCVLRHLGMLGGLQLKDLASKCHISRPTMTGVIDTMEKNKVVARVNNPEDRRSILVILTKKGKEIYSQIPKQEKIAKTCCFALKSNEIEQMNILLEKFDNNFKDNFEQMDF